ncbi:recombination protein RecR [Candidatus Peregrinibacteria bacterium]|jgi:recombination protein RecR|nr:recombination protein RecR [Candidatus Peregrinibacteria bacterium]
MFNTALKQLIEMYSALPGIGEKTAERLAFYTVKQGKDYQKSFAEVLDTLDEKIHYCKKCANFSDEELCDVCMNDKRNQRQICIVETPFDVQALERTNIYDGVYHVLHGVLSPIDGIGPENIKIQELLYRISEDPSIEEIVFALSPSLEGEATTNYIKKSFPEHIGITQLARGMPSGASVEYADELTLKRALQERR